MIKMKYFTFFANSSFPSLINTANVTAGLKCPPHIGPKRMMFPNRQAPIATG